MPLFATLGSRPCKAINCETSRGSHGLFCPYHWNRLPHHHRKLIFDTYCRGAARGIPQPPSHLLAIRVAVNWLGVVEGHLTIANARLMNQNARRAADQYPDFLRDARKDP